MYTGLKQMQTFRLIMCATTSLTSILAIFIFISTNYRSSTTITFAALLFVVLSQHSRRTTIARWHHHHININTCNYNTAPQARQSQGAGTNRVLPEYDKRKANSSNSSAVMSHLTNDRIGQEQSSSVLPIA